MYKSRCLELGTRCSDVGISFSKEQAGAGRGACVRWQFLVGVFWSEIFLRLKYIKCIASGCFNTFVQ